MISGKHFMQAALLVCQTTVMSKTEGPTYPNPIEHVL